MKTNTFYLVFVIITLGVLFQSVIFASTISYTYDEINRLTVVEKSGEYRIEYSYDATGNRTTKVVSVSLSPFDDDQDGDVDGSDLAQFYTEWDGSPQTLENFAGDFGSN